MTPFKNVQKCVEAINKIDANILNEISDMIRTRFIAFLKHQYGAEVYEPNYPLEAEGDFFIILADDIKGLLAYICGDESERRYKIEIETAARDWAAPQVRFISVRFISWVPQYCSVHCTFDGTTLTLMPMTAAIIRFSKTVRMRVTPL